MQLHLVISGKRKLISQIYRQLRAAILQGRLSPGDRLPSTRELAERLGVARKTVTLAYDLLLSEGFVTGRTGSGTFVSEDVPIGRSSVSLVRESSPIEVLPVWQELTTTTLRRGRKYTYDFAVGVPDRIHFPFQIWRSTTASRSRFLAKSGTNFSEVQGYPELRGAIAKYIAFTRAVVCEAEDVIVTNGAQQAFDLIGRVLIRPGDIVAFEEPGYPMARDIFRTLGARLMGVPVDEEGLTVERLPKGAKLVYVTPSHQFPLGVPMSLPRRVALLDWAAARGTAIIEDDYDSEFRFEGRPLESLQNLDRHGIVFYVGTFSKVLFPDLRLGFAIAPRAVRSALIAAKRVSDWYTALLEQATLAKFIQDGDLARHVRKMHTIYNRRRKCLLEGLRKKLSRWLHPIPSVAGLHTSAYLPPAMSADSLVKAAAKADVGVYSLDLYRTEKSPRPGIAFGYGAIEATEITQGLARLYRVLQQNV